MNYLTRAVSLLTKSKILDRALLTSCDPPLYFLIEIKNPWLSSNALAYKIVQTVKEKYTQSFEEALRETNEMLAKLTEEGNTEWLGKLSSIIATVDQDKLNLASVGNASCFLIRDRNIIEITEDQPREIHPLKTFSHILNGDLMEADQLVIGNQDFFENLSLDYLKQVLGSGPTKEAISNIGRSLQKERIKIANALILEIKRTSPKEVISPPEIFYLDQSKRLVTFWQKTKQIASKISRWFIEKTKKLTKDIPILKKFSKRTSAFFEKRRRVILLTISLLLLLALIFGIFSIVAERQRGKEIQSQRKTIIQAEDKYREADKALAKGDKEQAKKLYQEALALVFQIKTKEGNSLKQKLTSVLDKLNNIVRVKSPKEIFDFSSIFGETSISQIFVIDKVIYSVDLKTNRIYQGDKTPNSLPQYSGQFVGGAYQTPEKLLIFYQDPEGIYEYKIDENRLEKADIVFEGKWERAKALGSYFANIYLLDPEEGQIYKHEKTAAGYSKGMPYVDKQKVDLKKAVSITLDGYVYILRQDGKILKLMAGRSVSDFSIKGIPEPEIEIKNPIKIFTASEIPNLYVLDGSRVLELDKSGNYLRMFIFDLANIKDLWVNYKSKKIYLLSESKVYEIGI